MASDNLLNNTTRAMMPDMWKFGENMIFSLNTEHFTNLFNQQIAFDGSDVEGAGILFRFGINTYDPAVSNLNSWMYNNNN